MAVASVRVPSNLPRYLEFLIPIWLFSAFFTGVKLIPQLANNVGLFEIVGLLVAIAFVAREWQSAPPRRHPLISTIMLMTLVAAISQLQVPSYLRQQGLVQVAILCFLLTYLIIFLELIRKYRISPYWLLQIVVVCVLAAGVLVAISGRGTAPGDVAGPFRNRAHMASYMLSAFWLCLIAVFWPQLKRLQVTLCLGGVMLALYSVAISGRRSVYLSLFLGMIALVAALLVAQRGRRLRWLLGIGLAIGFLSGLYVLGDRLTAQTAFFQTRVGLVDDRLRSFLGDDEMQTGELSFFSLQRQGVMNAVRASPILGIGWGGFPDSDYSPTGHEVHSTPMRFLAELGFVGLALYLAFMAYLLTRSVRLFLAMRQSPYGNSYLVLAIAVWSMSVSYIYNRHMTERTFWILLAVFLAMEGFALDWHTLKARFSVGRRREADPLDSAEPAREHALAPPQEA